jgi:hypothetical protein
LIPDVSLVDESTTNKELDESADDQSMNEPVLDTSIDNEFLHVDSMTIGDLADRTQLTARTVVLDKFVCRIVRSVSADERVHV